MNQPLSRSIYLIVEFSWPQPTEPEDEVSQDYTDFFSRMPRVQDKIREEVIFQ